MKPWIVDANLSSENDEDLLRFTPIGNDEIRSFLHATDSGPTVLVAPKGFGKTLLLKKKSTDIRRENPSILFYPIDGRYESIVCESALPQIYRHYQAFEGLPNWTFIWTLAISSIVAKRIDQEPKTSNYTRWFKNKKTIGAHLDTIIHAWPDYRSALEAEYMNGLRPIFENCNAPIAIFIDAPDEALSYDYSISGDVVSLRKSRTSRKRGVVKNDTTIGIAEQIEKLRSVVDIATAIPAMWVEIQLGLVEAIRKLSKQNPHIRVYATIRSEAMNVKKGVQQQQNQSLCVPISYTKDELQEIFERNIQWMDTDKLVIPAADSLIEAFLGARKVPHGSVKSTNGDLEQELVFDAIHRHTFSRPRDLMEIGRRLAAIPKQLRTAGAVRAKVNDVGHELFEFYKAQAIPLWQTSFDWVLENVSSNIISEVELKEIRGQYFKKYKSGTCPFAYLYAHGILGILQRDPLTNSFSQIFVTGTEEEMRGSSVLPPAEYYFLHPCTYAAIRAKKGENFQSSEKAIVGYDREFIPDPLIELRVVENRLSIKFRGKATPYEIGEGNEREPDVMLVVALHAAKKFERISLSSDELLSAHDDLRRLKFLSRDHFHQMEAALGGGDSSHSKKLNEFFRQAEAVGTQALKTYISFKNGRLILRYFPVKDIQVQLKSKISG